MIKMYTWKNGGLYFTDDPSKIPEDCIVTDKVAADFSEEAEIVHLVSKNGFAFGREHNVHLRGSLRIRAQWFSADEPVTFEPVEKWV